MSTKELISTIKEKSLENFNYDSNYLLPGLTDDEIVKFENEFNFKLPIEIQDYLKESGGENEDNGELHGLFLGLIWLPIDGIKRELKIWKDVINQNPEFEEEEYQSFPENAVQEKYVDADNWIGLAIDGCGNSIGIDLKPGSNGKIGQVIAWGRDYNDYRIVLFENWNEFLKVVVEKLKDETFYKIDSEYNVYELGEEVNFLDYLYENKLKEYLGNEEK